MLLKLKPSQKEVPFPTLIDELMPSSQQPVPPDSFQCSKPIPVKCQKDIASLVLSYLKQPW